MVPYLTKTISSCLLIVFIFVCCAQQRDGNIEPIPAEIIESEPAEIDEIPDNRELLLGFWRLDSVVIEDRTINKNVFSECYSQDSLYCFRLDTAKVKCEYKSNTANMFTVLGDTIYDHIYYRQFRRLGAPDRKRIILEINETKLVYNMPNNEIDQIHYLSKME